MGLNKVYLIECLVYSPRACVLGFFSVLLLNNGKNSKDQLYTFDIDRCGIDDETEQVFGFDTSPAASTISILLES